MSFLDFKQLLTEPGVWKGPAVKADGAEFYDYVLLCTDDALVIR